MKKITGMWSAATGAERFVAVAVTVAALGAIGFGAWALFVKRPGDVSNPDATFEAKQTKKKKPVKDRTVDWTRFGYDMARTKFLDAQQVRPPFAKQWRFQGDELIEFAPIIAANRLYFIDNDGLYVALDARNGKVVWKKRLASLNASSPALENGVLYSVSLEPAQVLAVRARDGKVLWRKSLPSRAESSPLVRNGRMYFGTESGEFFALKTKNGSEDWSTSVAGSVKAAPAFADGTLYFGDYGGQMNAVRASDGKVVWQTQDLGTGLGGSGRIYSTAAVAFGRVYAGNVDGRMYSFDASNGDIAWTFSAGDFVYSGPAAADTKGTKPTVYFGSHDATAYAVDAKTGKVRWAESPGGQVSGPATVVGDVAYVSTFSGNSTVGFDLETGRRVFSFDDGEYGPVVSDGETLYMTGGASVIAFKRVDLGGYKYKTNKGQRGVVPPKERRKALKLMREKAAKQKAKREKRPEDGEKAEEESEGDGEAPGGNG